VNFSLNKRHIVVISDCYGGHNSGAKLLTDLTSELVDRGYNVANISTYRPRATGKNYFAGSTAANFTRYLCRGLSEVLRAIAVPVRVFFLNPKIIFVYAPSIFLVPAGVFAAQISGAKCILIQRDLVPQWMVDSEKIRRGGLAERLLLKVSYFNYRHVDGVAVQSERDREILRQMPVYIGNVEVVPNWRNFNSFLSHRPASFLAQKKIVSDISKSPPKKPLRILYAGNIGEAQAIARVIVNLVKINRVYPISLEIYGFGSQLDSVLVNVTAAHDAGILSIYPLIDELSLFKRAHAFDYGLVCLDEKISTGIIPSKIATYLIAGLPLLGVAGRSSTLGEFIESKKVGVFIPVLHDEKAFDDEKTCIEISNLLIKTISMYSPEHLVECAEREFAVEPVVDRLLEMAAS